MCYKISRAVMEISMSSSMSSTPVRAGANSVPSGHVIVNEKWRGSELVQGFQGRITVIFEDGLGLVDFHISKRLCVLYVSEADLVAGSAYKRKLVRFRNASTLNGIVVVEKSPLSEQYFPAVQRFVVLELGMTVLPVANQTEASHLIAQLIHEESKEQGRNPFQRRAHSHLCDARILASIQQIPGVGKVKAMSLLQHFPSIQQLSVASTQELEAVVGQALAQQITWFFSPPN
ncbi:Fanconi anemia core complex-associated protein 24-like isoform X2 [Hemiscyllium ocellatum]|uniref:Fanconi anemia core complex-associated protein 24-like isoform X2 n=1 Tax=Hemiscyllium ocellatum TaxID=170820 RepID=UPI0029666866|nr:Fanconi anemia core complex-associated protein 24-like isoform X2 [Hemiscyllium ocellatum]